MASDHERIQRDLEQATQLVERAAELSGDAELPQAAEYLRHAAVRLATQHAANAAAKKTEGHQ